jgi:hypothetical protein
MKYALIKMMLCIEKNTLNRHMGKSTSETGLRIFSTYINNISQGERDLIGEGIKNFHNFYLFPKDHVVKQDRNPTELLIGDISLKINLMSLWNKLIS